MPESAASVATVCAVCASPVVREIDMMLLEGWEEDTIMAALPDAPRDPIAIAAHWRGGHANYDKAALTVVTVSVMRDARKLRNLAMDEAKRGNYRFAGPLSKSLELSYKGVDLMARMHGVGRSDGAEAPRNGDMVNIQAILNFVLATDPEAPYRIAHSFIESKHQPKAILRKQPKAESDDGAKP